MISSGEDTGKLDMVLERVSGYYDNEVDTAIKTQKAAKSAGRHSSPLA